MRVCRAARLLVRKNFNTKGLSRRVVALHYVPSMVMTSLTDHKVDPSVIEHMVRDAAACEAISFVGQVAIILLNTCVKSVSKDLRIRCDNGICEVSTIDDSPS